MVKVKEIPFGAVMILPPAPDKCQICAAEHRVDMPHNRDSLYYQMKFYQKHGRYPTWHDAMAHCSPKVKAAWKQALADKGIVIGEPPQEK